MRTEGVEQKRTRSTAVMSVKITKFRKEEKMAKENEWPAVLSRKFVGTLQNKKNL